MLTPTLSPHLPGHILTFLECCLALKAGKSLEEIDSGVSKKVSMPVWLQVCHCIERDEDHHHHLVHPTELRAQQRQAQQENRKSTTSEPQAAEKSCHRYQGRRNRSSWSGSRRTNVSPKKVGLFKGFVTFTTPHDPYHVTVTDCHSLRPHKVNFLFLVLQPSQK